jgi:hypothetical protein
MCVTLPLALILRRQVKMPEGYFPAARHVIQVRVLRGGATSDREASAPSRSPVVGVTANPHDRRTFSGPFRVRVPIRLLDRPRGSAVALYGTDPSRSRVVSHCVLESGAATTEESAPRSYGWGRPLGLPRDNTVDNSDSWARHGSRCGRPSVPQAPAERPYISSLELREESSRVWNGIRT